MGAAASFVGESATEFENFKLIRDEYEAKVASGASDTELYDHIKAIMNSLGAVKLSLDLLAAKNENNNCTDDIVKRAGLNLLATDGSKVLEMKTKVEASLIAAAEVHGWGAVVAVQAPCAVVTASDNFDSLRVPVGHYSRMPTDVYYCDKNKLLRTQLTAHLLRTVKAGTFTYVMSGDTFRIIEEDDVQSELQHKLEFVRIYPTLAAAPEGDDDSDLPEDYLTAAEIIVKSVIGRSDVLTRWEESDEAFHLRGGCFNDLQAKVGDRILDLVRGGRLTDEMLTESLGLEADKSGYVITFDLDHLAMLVDHISDIRQLHGGK